MTLETQFSIPAVHHVVYADDFCPFAHEIRDELLRYPAWAEMTQDSRFDAVSQPRTDRQNGITTRHIGEQQRAMLPSALAFQDMLYQRAESLAARVGVDAAAGLEIEMNAMAYGEGAWLSPHSDYRPDDARPRRVAWMLYLTNPEDGEWSTEKGGAVRLFEKDVLAPLSAAHRSETRIRPRFNRFAMFQVSEGSLHEIEAISWSCGWERCRMALSGWFRGPDTSGPMAARLYVRRPDADDIRAQREARLRGAIAMYRLLRLQQAHAGNDSGSLDDVLKRYEAEREAQSTAPAGTVFLRHAPGPAWCVVVIDETEKVVYLGPRDGYRGG